MTPPRSVSSRARSRFMRVRSERGVASMPASDGKPVSRSDQWVDQCESLALTMASRRSMAG